MAKDTIKVNRENLGILLICAIRYCHGRQSYMPGLVTDIGRGVLREISDKDLTILLQDCEFQAQYDLYGNEKIDKPGWLKWKADLLAERERRNEHTD